MSLGFEGKVFHLAVSNNLRIYIDRKKGNLSYLRLHFLIGVERKNGNIVDLLWLRWSGYWISCRSWGYWQKYLDRRLGIWGFDGQTFCGDHSKYYNLIIKWLFLSFLSWLSSQYNYLDKLYKLYKQWAKSSSPIAAPPSNSNSKAFLPPQTNGKPPMMPTPHSSPIQSDSFNFKSKRERSFRENWLQRNWGSSRKRIKRVERSRARKRKEMQRKSAWEK